MRRPVPHFQGNREGDHDDENEQAEDAPNEITEEDHDSGREREFGAEAGKQGGENRHDFPEEKDDNAACNRQHADWIDQRGLHRALQLDVFLDVSGEALKNGVQNTARFARLHHVDVQRVENLRILPHGRRKSCASFHGSARSDEHLLKELVLLLPGKNFQALHQRQPGVDHDGELARKDGQFLRFNLAAESGQVEFLALLGHLGRRDLLAPQDVGELRLVRSRQFAAHAGAGTIGSSIGKDRHVSSSSVGRIAHCGPPRPVKTPSASALELSRRVSGSSRRD